MRLQKKKVIRDKLRKGKVSLGTWQQLPNASVSEVLGSLGFDWVAVDMEHGAIDSKLLPDICRAVELNNTLPLVRVLEATESNCKQALDSGAGGIIAPMIKNADQLIKIKDFCCWPPSGSRGVGFSRANNFGEKFDEYLIEAQDPLLIAQIEHIEAVDNLEEILKVKGLDAIIIGPYDLSASMGLTGNFRHDKFLESIDLIFSLSKKYNVSCGQHIVKPDLKLLQNNIQLGYQFIAYSIDAVLLYESAKKVISFNK